VPNASTSPVFVSSAAATKVFRWRDAIGALQTAYGDAIPAAAAPPRTVAALENVWLRTLPAIAPGCRHFGAKLMGVALSADQPAVEYVIVLFDRQTSRIAAFVDGAQVTAYRTAATSAAAVDRMAHSGPARLAVLGSGLEAAMHARAIAAVRPLAEISVFSPTTARREQFAVTMAGELGVPARAMGTPVEATQEADIIVAAARSYGEQPILFADWLKPRALVVSIGSTVPQQRELDVSVLARASLIVCDRPDEVISDTGDMIAAARAGMDIAPKCRSLGALMAGRIPIPSEPSAVLVYKSVGSGLQDIVVADLILAGARQAGLVAPLAAEFSRKPI